MFREENISKIVKIVSKSLTNSSCFNNNVSPCLYTDYTSMDKIFCIYVTFALDKKLNCKECFLEIGMSSMQAIHAGTKYAIYDSKALYMDKNLLRTCASPTKCLKIRTFSESVCKSRSAFQLKNFIKSIDLRKPWKNRFVPNEYKITVIAKPSEVAAPNNTYCVQTRNTRYFYGCRRCLMNHKASTRSIYQNVLRLYTIFQLDKSFDFLRVQFSCIGYTMCRTLQIIENFHCSGIGEVEMIKNKMVSLNR